jgi:transcriptional regulator with XRE-family HTH domain
MSLSPLAEERAVLGLLVVLLRSLRHWSQAELARASGVQKSQISLYEQWKSAPAEPTLKRLAAAVGITWADALNALPALRALYRLAKGPASKTRPGATKTAATIGRAAAYALEGRVLPFLRERLQPLGNREADHELPWEGEAAAVGLLIVLLRSVRHWIQEKLASASGIRRSRISAYELAKRLPRRRTQERLISAAGLPLDGALGLLPVLRELVRAAGNRPAAANIAGAVGRMAESLVLIEAEPFVAERLPSPAHGAARSRSEALWQELAKRTPAERWRMVEEHEAYRTWALAERTALASETRAADDADAALDLARLAVRMAELAPEDDDRRAGLGGFCWGFLGNAQRVKGDFPAAEEAFLRSDRLWREGAAADPGLPLDGTRLLDLKATLRRSQGRYDESFQLLEGALPGCRTRHAEGRILLKIAVTLEQEGDWQKAIEMLEKAAARLDPREEPRLLCIVRFSLGVNLCNAGRYGEALELLPEVRRLTHQLGNGLDLLRVRWLDALVSAGLDKIEEAVAGLEHVSKELIRLGIAFDAARACLDLAQLYLRQGRTADVKRIAAQVVEVFKVQKVPEPALAAVILFQQAAEQERATIELARDLSAYLRRAEGNPGLRFEE